MRAVIIHIYYVGCLRIVGKKAVFYRAWTEMSVSGLWYGGGRKGFDSCCRGQNCTCVSTWFGILSAL